MTTRLIIGTRGSKLALAQAGLVVETLRRAQPGIKIEVQVIKTRGDALRDSSLARMGGKGVFVKEIEEALLAGEIDLAAHSLKDLPTELPPGLIIGAVLVRADPRDVLVTHDGTTLDALPRGARIGTGSARRAAQLAAYRPDLEVVDIRGNVDTRLRKLDQGDYDGVILAAAGLERLGLIHRVAEFLDPQVMLPAAGQGALAVEVREGDGRIRELILAINHEPSRAAVTAERAFLRRLGGGCRVPIAAHAVVNHDRLTLEGLVASPDGKRVIRRRAEGKTEAAEEIGHQLAETYFVTRDP